MLLHLVLVVLSFIAVSGSSDGSILTEQDIGDRIIGGEAATIEEIPYQGCTLASIGESAYCGASVLSETLVVTAAHCIHSKFKYVRVGTNKRKTNEGQTVRIKTMVKHKDYNKGVNLNNDIALLFLESPLKFGDTVQPIKLPKQDQTTAAGTNVLVSGFGTLKGGTSNHPKILQKVTVPIIDQDECKSLYRNLISEGMICAGLVETGGKDACQGDSGGPLVADSVLLGITSWGFGCAEPKKPGVYTRVAKYVDWIREQNNLYGSSEI